MVCGSARDAVLMYISDPISRMQRSHPVSVAIDAWAVSSMGPKNSKGKEMSLTSDQRALLLLALSHTGSPLKYKVERHDPTTLRLEERNLVRMEVGKELALYGFDGTQPNELGLALEAIIDVLGPRDDE